MNADVIAAGRRYQWGGAAFALGNLLFLVNKFDEMSRLFLGRPMRDVISGQDPALIFLGQAALIVGFVAYFQFYACRVTRAGKIALGLLSSGGITLAIGHLTFIPSLGRVVPSALLPYVEFLFAFVVIGLAILLTGLIWFGILALRKPILGALSWLPLFTGVMGFLGFFLFIGDEINPTFLVFRTLFALGLMVMGVVLWLERPNPGLGDMRPEPEAEALRLESDAR